MHLVEVIDPRSRRQFHAVPERVYANDRVYIPHLWQDIEKIFDPSENSLFAAGGKAIRWVLLDETGDAIGRVAAFINPDTAFSGRYCIGGMGFFDCTENQQAAFLLFDACKNWLQKQGIRGMDGPVNFGDRSRFWGLLVENFSSPNSYAMNYNPRYYRDFFEKYGFRNYFEQFVYRRAIQVALPELFNRKAAMISSDPEFSVRTMKGISIEKIADYFVQVYNETWDSPKIEKDRAAAIFRNMKKILDRDLLIFAFYKNRPVGFYLNMPELNEFFRHLNGNLNAWGKVKFAFLFWFKQRKTMVGLIFGVSGEFQSKGVESALIRYCEQEVLPFKTYSDTILTWIGDFNPRMIKVAEQLGATLYRKLITYRLLFDEDLSFERHPVIESKGKAGPAQSERSPKG